MPDIALWPSCDHKCTMCSNEQNYKLTSKDYTFANIKKRIDKFVDGDQTQFYRFPEIKDDWTITGGEPTLNPDYFRILEYIREKFPNSKLVQLTHGDNFANEEFTKKIATIENYHLVFPIHGYNKETHEEIVRKKGSWELLLRGIDNVLRYKKSNNQTLELRIIIQGQNYKHLDKIYELIHKYFPQVDSVVSIMMEYEGQAIDNISLTKVNYRDVLTLNENIFLKWGNIFGKEKFKLYHFPLCTIQNKNLWKYIWRTLPPDEIEFLDTCNTCELRKYCMGIHENYCKFNGESEIKSFQQKDLFGSQIIENEENLRFHPIKEVKKNNSPGKKTVIFTGYACNNICRFCIDLNKREINRTTKEILKDILIAKKNKTQILEIIGGEVTIRKDFFVIMEFLKSMKFEHVYLVTNGNRLADFNFAKKFYDLGVIHSIVFSIHGHTEELHDLLTATPGSFKKLLKGIKNWQELGFSKNKIGTNTAIENGNYKYLEEIGKLVKKLGCLGSSEFIFADPNQGGVNNEFDKLMPRISKSAPYMRKLLDWGNENSMIYRVRYVPLCYFQEYMENNISELKEIEIYSNVTHSAPDFYNSNVVEGRKNSGRIKTKKCEGCRLHDKCEGIWTTYYEKLGDEELLPISNLEKVKFLQSFSKEDYLLNEHLKKDYIYIVNIYNEVIPFIQNGNYIELGCGTGISPKFYSQFAGKLVVPYGIDKNEKAIRLAKINNPEFEKNFLVGDYFNTNLDFSKFSTISLHFNFKYSVTKIVKLIEYIYNNCIINTKIIIYNSDTFTKKNLILNKKLIKSLLSQKYYFLHFHENFIILNKN